MDIATEKTDLEIRSDASSQNTGAASADAANGAAQAQTVELLYAWINCDETGFIQKQGFNFSPKYTFDMVESPKGYYTLNYRENKNYPNVWEFGSIVNLTAVIGQNGSGKSALLKHLANAIFLPVKETDKADDTFNNDQGEDLRDAGTMLLAYRINKEVRIFHNMAENLLTYETDLNVKRYTVQDQSEIQSIVNAQTKIYMSNVLSAARSIWETNGDQKAVIFTPAGNYDRTKMFFMKICGLNKWNIPKTSDADNQQGYQFTQISYPAAAFYYLQYQISSSRNYRDFERLAAILYFYHLHTTNTIDEQMIDHSRDLIVGVENFYKLTKTLPYTEFTYHRKKYQNNMGYIHTDYRGWQNHNSANATINEVLDLYLRYEEKLVGFFECDDNYLLKAREQIHALWDILKDCQEEPDHQTPQNKWQPAKRVRIPYDRSKDSAYFRFCAFIIEQIQADYSFVLKYLSIEIPPMSSGEQAMQNIFAWLNLPPIFDDVFGEKAVAINSNILLLLDEVDLYMHPEWQRQFLYELSERLKKEYPHNHIQVVISTHSPLVLSDVPAGNTIYLDKDGDHCTLASREARDESFGANLFSLLKDSFFLKKSLGQFAYTKISTIIDHLEKLKILNKLEQDIAEIDWEEEILRDKQQERRQLEESLMKQYAFPNMEKFKETCRAHRRVIDIIGEPMLREKLRAMHNDLFEQDHEDIAKQTLDKLRSLLENGNSAERDRYRKQLKEILLDTNAD